MANQEHLAILAKGVETWNQWRTTDAGKDHPDLQSAWLTDVDLSDINLRNADLTNAILQQVEFVNANLTGAILNRALIENCNLTRAKLAETNLGSAMALYSEFRDADLQYAVLMWAQIIGSNFSNVALNGSSLTYATFNRTNLSRASLRDADLTLTSLIDSDLTATEFAGARFGWTTLACLTLGAASGLDLAKHTGPSDLAIGTLMERRELPDTFLRGIGLPESTIEQVGKLRPSDFYSCFISYSSRDQAFADFLYKHLQENKVRCWLATEDLKIGEQFRAKIEESILRHDKLLLILSHDSVGSPWVKSEVEAAFEKERRGGASVLFPIRLDDSVMESRQDWAAEIRRTRHIGDFRSWQDPNFYSKALTRLLRDLKGAFDDGGAKPS